MEVLLFKPEPQSAIFGPDLIAGGPKTFVNNLIVNHGPNVPPRYNSTAYARRFNSKAHFDIDFSFKL